MNLRNKINKKVSTPVFFILAIIIISFFFPREGSFNYTYVEGKPWKYGLLTASFDFPIYKAEDVVNAERDSILKDYQPYYTIDPEIATDAISVFEKDANARSLPREYISYAKLKLSELYKAGIISTRDFEDVSNTHQKRLQVRLLTDNINNSRHIASLYTAKQAYEKLIQDAPSNLELSILRSLNINNYISENTFFEAETSGKAKQELLNQIPIAEGMVQSGEKIIDRGEIVDSKTYNILNSLYRVTEEKAVSKVERYTHLFGGVIIIGAMIMSFMLYLIFFRPREYSDRKSVIFMLSMITLSCIITGLTVNYKMYSYIYIIPFAIPTMMIRTFIDSRTAMISHLVMILICAIMVPLSTEFLMIQIPVGFTCIFGLKNLSERSQLIKSSFFILLTYNLLYTAFILCQEGDITHVNAKMYLYFGINFIFVMFSYLLVYICEKTFGFLSGVSLVELSNIDKPLLQKLSEVAPGTFQHSMQVANLATAAAVRIGANAALARTGALYHDIGKMANPAFFTENQQPGMNPHQNLTYKESAQIIINHVADGVKIAEKHGLPKQIIDFIETHHGKGKAKYFYNSYKNEFPDEEVDEADFSYPGPNPFSKETAILMMADSVEAASRSLPEYTDESIHTLIDRLIDGQVSDGLLKNAPITFQDIELVKDVFFDKLKTIYHTRISYPELIKNKK